jgi:hypothetical protein
VEVNRLAVAPREHQSCDLEEDCELELLDQAVDVGLISEDQCCCESPHTVGFGLKRVEVLFELLVELRDHVQGEED